MEKERKTIEAILRKDEQVLFRFYRKHYRPLFQFLFRQLKNRETCEELAQDVFLEFIEGLRSFRGESSLKTYLFTIARYKAIDHMKKKQLKKVLFSALPPAVVEGLARIFMDDKMEQKELAAKIERVISKLPNDYQVVLRLKYVDGRRVKEIAAKLALPFKATESLLFRARTAFIRVYQSVA
jgi:RNA polymerase sigma-70 factor (ECF subfamily)